MVRRVITREDLALTPEQKELFDKHAERVAKGVVYNMARFSGHVDRLKDDALNSALIGIWKFSAKYHPDKWKAPYIKAAGYAARNAVIDWLRVEFGREYKCTPKKGATPRESVRGQKKMRYATVLSLQALAATRGVMFVDKFSSSARSLDNPFEPITEDTHEQGMQDQDDLSAAISVLPGKHRKRVMAMVLQGIPQCEIAKIIGIHGSRVSQIIRSSLPMMQVRIGTITQDEYHASDLNLA